MPILLGCLLLYLPALFYLKFRKKAQAVQHCRCFTAVQQQKPFPARILCGSTIPYTCSTAAVYQAKRSQQPKPRRGIPVEIRAARISLAWQVRRYAWLLSAVSAKRQRRCKWRRQHAAAL
ncbi:hypothetical protein NPIL_361951 [Nephila pilipes]|uniref:Secreted protein n=1 Tax=Nephila pilipes TaxID=299642 RepID=A0A8X6R8L5_NEPPI|nr:hypothetical protein NPIL_361951 [Nephila pilipes]